MDGSRFDAWTRRRVGLATGGAAASLLGLGGDVDAARRGKKKRNKKKNKRKRCLKLGRSCVPGQGRRCCGELECDQHLVNAGGATFCCKIGGKPCVVTEDCCTPNACINNICQLLN